MDKFCFPAPCFAAKVLGLFVVLSTKSILKVRASMLKTGRCVVRMIIGGPSLVVDWLFCLLELDSDWLLPEGSGSDSLVLSGSADAKRKLSNLKK